MILSIARWEKIRRSVIAWRPRLWKMRLTGPTCCSLCITVPSATSITYRSKISQNAHRFAQDKKSQPNSFSSKYPWKISKTRKTSCEYSKSASNLKSKVTTKACPTSWEMEVKLTEIFSRSPKITLTLRNLFLMLASCTLIRRLWCKVWKMQWCQNLTDMVVAKTTITQSIAWFRIKRARCWCRWKRQWRRSMIKLPFQWWEIRPRMLCSRPRRWILTTS